MALSRPARPAPARAAVPMAAARLALSVQAPRVHCPLHQHRYQLPSLSRRCSRSHRGLLRPSASAAAAASQQPGSSPAVQHSWFSDAWKEESRKEMRSVFDHDRWRMHRSSSRYLRHVLGIFESRIIQGVIKPLAYVVTVALAVGAYHTLAGAGHLPVWPDLKPAANALLGLTSFALSLLLVFRTNSSYARWDEARKLWGQIVNSSRDIVRQGMGYIPAEQRDLQSKLCRWTVAYGRSLLCHLRSGEDLEAELKATLTPEELTALLAVAHRPLYCCQVLTAIIQKAQMSGSTVNNKDSGACVPAGAAYRMDENVSVFTAVSGACERILRTPIPLSYTRHTSRFMMIWLTLLPFNLWGSCGWAMLPISAIVAFLLLGIEEIGVSIEEPFSILPLEAINGTIEANIWQMHRLQGEPVAV